MSTSAAMVFYKKTQIMIVVFATIISLHFALSAPIVSIDPNYVDRLQTFARSYKRMVNDPSTKSSLRDKFPLYHEWGQQQQQQRRGTKTNKESNLQRTVVTAESTANDDGDHFGSKRSHGIPSIDRLTAIHRMEQRPTNEELE